jgi:hypothetical protein
MAQARGLPSDDPRSARAGTRQSAGRAGRRVIRLTFAPAALRLLGEMTAREDIALVAGQLANLTRTVAEMETQVRTLRERADNQQERADQQRDRTEIQQERIDLAARELAEVSERLQAAADALRAAI